MMKSKGVPVFALCFFGLALGSPQAQGGSAIVTLVMPPPGGEGYSILQSGGLFADGATSTYYNPALLANLERQTGSQAHLSYSHQDLVPSMRISNLYQEFWGVAAVAPDSKDETDLGIGFFRNAVHFGETVEIDANGKVVSRLVSTEDVYALGIGMRLGLPVSLGLTAKYIDSRLLPNLGSGGESHSFALDLGSVVNPTWVMPKGFWPSTEFTPSFSMALKNLGPDVFYSDPEKADPIPRTYSFGVGLQVRMVDLFEIMAGYTEDREVTRRTSWSVEPVAVTGFSVAAAFYRYSAGWLEDPDGKRDEKHRGHALEFDLRRIIRVWRRLQQRDFQSPSTSFDTPFPFPPARILGFSYRANPRLSGGTREIRSQNHGIRDHQEAFFISLSL